MNILDEFDTITAVSTPFGTGGVGVIRVSGSKAYDILNKIFKGKTLVSEFKPSHFYHGVINDGKNVIDEVIILPFFAPNSYTGENVFEVQCHGGINVVDSILDLILKQGARLAEKGEFTKRAFLNKKLDLAQAEAVADLIHSKTKDFVIPSSKNLKGALSVKISEIKQNIVDVLSRIVAGIDFPEDVPEPDYEYLIEKFSKSIAEIDKILAGAKSSNIMRQGITVSIAGKPNVGKSSLFNSLLNHERAIVTEIAGTTRDVIKETLDLGIPVTLVDTAGIRSDNGIDKVEQIGIEYSKQTLDESDCVIFVYDASVGVEKEDKEILKLINPDKLVICANKSDISGVKAAEGEISISAKTGAGIDNLKSAIKNRVCNINPEELDYVTNIRQQNCLERAKASLSQALAAAEYRELQDLISIDVKSAVISLDELSGEVITDNVLNNIFDNFCIGK